MRVQPRDVVLAVLHAPQTPRQLFSPDAELIAVWCTGRLHTISRAHQLLI